MQPINLNKNYLISKDGQLFSRKSNRFIVGSANNIGYRIFCIRDEKNKPCFPKAHRLVAQTFIPNHENKPQVNHKDGNRLNNTLENLEWCTAKENLEHAKNVLGKKVYFQTGVKHHNAKLNKQKVRAIRNKYKTGKYTFRGLAKMYGVSSLVINQVIHNRTWQGI